MWIKLAWLIGNILGFSLKKITGIVYLKIRLKVWDICCPSTRNSFVIPSEYLLLSFDIEREAKQI